MRTRDIYHVHHHPLNYNYYGSRVDCHATICHPASPFT